MAKIEPENRLVATGVNDGRH